MWNILLPTLCSHRRPPFFKPKSIECLTNREVFVASCGRGLHAKVFYRGHEYYLEGENPSGGLLFVLSPSHAWNMLVSLKPTKTKLKRSLLAILYGCYPPCTPLFVKLICWILPLVHARCIISQNLIAKDMEPIEMMACNEINFARLWYDLEVGRRAENDGLVACDSFWFLY